MSKPRIITARSRRRTRSGRGWLRQVEVIVPEATPESLGFVVSEVLRLTLAEDKLLAADIEIVVRFS